MADPDFERVFGGDVVISAKTLVALVNLVRPSDVPREAWEVMGRLAMDSLMRQFAVSDGVSEAPTGNCHVETIPTPQPVQDIRPSAKPKVIPLPSQPIPITDDRPALLRTIEVAKLLSLSRTTIHEMVSTGQLPSVRVGRAIRISRAAVEEWMGQSQATAKKQDAS